jgi:hypothetical protein
MVRTSLGEMLGTGGGVGLAAGFVTCAVLRFFEDWIRTTSPREDGPIRHWLRGQRITTWNLGWGEFTAWGTGAGALLALVMFVGGQT